MLLPRPGIVSWVVLAMTLTLVCQAAGHNIGRREPSFAGYAVLYSLHHNVALLLDTLHKHLTVRVLDRNECYLLPLSETRTTLLRLVVHIYKQGPSVLTSEFQLAGEVSHGWVSSNVGSEQNIFCIHDRLLVLQNFGKNSAPVSEVTQLTSQPTPLIG